MDASVAAALVVALASLMVSGCGGLFALYQFRHKRTRQASHDFQEAQAKHIDLLETEKATLQKQMEELKIRNTTLLQALSVVYRRPVEEIEWRLNSVRLPEARN